MYNLILFFNLFYLQSCVHFCCTARRLSYTRIYIFSAFFPMMVDHRALNRVPCAVQEGVFRPSCI